jgi:hypothetical protein
MNKQSEALDLPEPAVPAPASVTLIGPVADAPGAAPNGRRDRKSRPDGGDRPHRERRHGDRNGVAAEADGSVEGGAESRQARAERRSRKSGPRAPRAERALAKSGDAPATPEGAEDAASSEEAIDAEAIDATLLLGVSGSSKRAARTLQRARKKQESAAAAVEQADDNPALGALNRHLNMLMQQLATAHRVIGRVAAERDALRQQLADLQGVPVDEIKVTAVGATAEPTERPATPHHAHASPSSSSSSLGAKLNYFGGDDIATVRRRRQSFVVVLLGVVAVLYWSSRMGYWAMPDNLSRDSLASLPYVGELMTYFLAGWMFFRVFRVSSKGVRWVFPSEDSRRRRR